MQLPSLSVIVPTYQEVENLPFLIEALFKIKKKYPAEFELLIVDDNSQDGTQALIASMHAKWIRLIIRYKDRGLSAAVLEGISQAKNEAVLVMDADLSHPVEAIFQMMEALFKGADFVIGSRYIGKGSTDRSWGLFRQLNSQVATWMTLPLTSVKDPMSGFFAFYKKQLNHSDPLNPIGYKIGLELLMKMRCKNIVEIPIHFDNRKHGKSKLSFKEQLNFIQHLRRLLIYKYPKMRYLSPFFVLGFLGFFINLWVFKT